MMAVDFQRACRPTKEERIEGLTRLADALEELGALTPFMEELTRGAGFDPETLGDGDNHSDEESYRFWRHFDGAVELRPLMQCEVCQMPTMAIWGMLWHFQDHGTKNAEQAGAWVRDIVETDREYDKSHTARDASPASATAPQTQDRRKAPSKRNSSNEDHG